MVLINAQDWTKRNVASSDEGDFIKASNTRQLLTITQEEHRKNELLKAGENLRAWQRRFLGTGLLAFLIIVIAIIVGKTEAQNVAQSNATLTAVVQKSNDIQIAPKLAVQAKDLLNGPSPDKIPALLMSIDSLNSIYSESADQTLGQSMYMTHLAPAFGLQISGIASTAFSPDGKTILTGSEDGTAQLWEIATEKSLQIFKVHMGAVTSVTFSPDGRTILTGSTDKTARLWDASTGNLLLTFEGHTDEITSVTFSPDGRTILTGSTDKTARLWDIQTGKSIQTFAKNTAGVTSVAFSLDGKNVLAGSRDGTARLWDVSTGNLASTFGHTDELTSNELTSVAFSPDGKSVLLGTGDGTARLWDIATGNLLLTFEGHTDAILSVAFSPDGKSVLTGSQDGTARLWDTTSGQALRLLKLFEIGGHGGAEPVYATFSPDSKTILTTSRQGVQLWEIANIPQVFNAPNDVISASIDDRSVTVATFSPDGKTLLAGTKEGVSRLWDITTGQILHSFVSQAKVAITCVAFSPDGKIVLTGRNDGITYLWNPATEKLLETLNSGTSFNAVTSAVFTPDSKIAVLQKGASTELWDITTSQLVNTFPIKSQLLAITPDGKTILTWDGQLDLPAQSWDITTGKLLQSFGKKLPITSVALAPDGKSVLIGTFNADITLWDIDTGNLIQTITGNDAYGVISVTFTPDNKILAVTVPDTYGDGGMVEWDLATGKEIQSIFSFSEVTSLNRALTFSPDHKSVLILTDDGTLLLRGFMQKDNLHMFGEYKPISSVAFSPDGKNVLIGSNDGTARLWDVATQHVLYTFKGTNNFYNLNNKAMTVGFSSDGKTIFISIYASQNGQIQFWDITNGQLLKSFTEPGEIVSLPDGNFMIIDTSFGKDKVVDSYGKELFSFTSPDSK